MGELQKLAFSASLYWSLHAQFMSAVAVCFRWRSHFIFIRQYICVCAILFAALTALPHLITYAIYNTSKAPAWFNVLTHTLCVNKCTGGNKLNHLQQCDQQNVAG